MTTRESAPRAAEMKPQFVPVELNELEINQEVKVGCYFGRVALISEPFINVKPHEGQGFSQDTLRLVHTGREVVSKLVYSEV